MKVAVITITLVEYTISDFKAVFYAESKIILIFFKSDQFFRYKHLLEMFRTVL